jgi:hypothetical protein
MPEERLKTCREMPEERLKTCREMPEERLSKHVDEGQKKGCQNT